MQERRRRGRIARPPATLSGCEFGTFRNTYFPATDKTNCNFVPRISWGVLQKSKRMRTREREGSGKAVGRANERKVETGGEGE